MRVINAALTLSLVFPLSILSAQNPPPSEPGSRVRVKQECTEGYTPKSNDLRTICPTHVGEFNALTADSIVLATGDREGRVAVPIASVTRLDVQRGRKSRAGRGALVGLVVGTVGGMVTGISWADQCTSGYYCPTNGIAAGAILAALFGGMGAGFGAIAGAFIKTDRWEEVPLDRLRMSFAPRRERVSFRLRIAF